MYQIDLAETFGSRAAGTVALDLELARSKSTASAPTVGSIEAQATRKENLSHSFLSMLLVDVLLFPLNVCTSYADSGFALQSYPLRALGNILYAPHRFLFGSGTAGGKIEQYDRRPTKSLWRDGESL